MKDLGREAKVRDAQAAVLEITGGGAGVDAERPVRCDWAAPASGKLSQETDDLRQVREGGGKDELQVSGVGTHANDRPDGSTV